MSQAASRDTKRQRTFVHGIFELAFPVAFPLWIKQQDVLRSKRLQEGNRKQPVNCARTEKQSCRLLPSPLPLLKAMVGLSLKWLSSFSPLFNSREAKLCFGQRCGLELGLEWKKQQWTELLSLSYHSCMIVSSKTPSSLYGQWINVSCQDRASKYPLQKLLSSQ